jgi:hypothetical protein
VHRYEHRACTSQLGKLHFGVILGWSVLQSFVIWWLLTQIVGPEATEAKALDLYFTCCVVGYCQLPLVICSSLLLLLPKYEPRTQSAATVYPQFEKLGFMFGRVRVHKQCMPCTSLLLKLYLVFSGGSPIMCLQRCAFFGVASQQHVY